MYFHLPKVIFQRLVRSFLKSAGKSWDHVFSKSGDHKKSNCGSEKWKYGVVFGSLVADEPEIEFVPVVNQEMVIITPPEHPLKYKKKLVLEDLLDYPVIGYDKTSGLGRLLILFTNKTISNRLSLLNLRMKMPCFPCCRRFWDWFCCTCRIITGIWCGNPTS